MRLTHLRLAGFKSFVEPTPVAIPSNLVGVVGPNGCGKSNIIDAVRWVLGESKASELRGETMQDVIFNGSTNRKPAARASVELVFDNSERRITGHWGQYGEISVKRILTRDGNSSYYINQQQVRRRDVQDIFLGTGLGPRAYAIIGQGMIARILESKPEELRVFLEEAAGVSKYKERRRETANRLQDTRENLSRVQDIVVELSTQIDRLSQQAEVAQRYQDYNANKSNAQRQLWALKLKEAIDQKNKLSAQYGRAQAELEQLNSESISAQSNLFAAREVQIDKQKQFELDQANWLQACRQVNQLEADLRVCVDTQARLKTRHHELESELQDWLTRLEQAQDKQHIHAAELNEQQALLETTEVDYEALQSYLAPQAQQVKEIKHALEQAQTRAYTAQREFSQAQGHHDSALRSVQTLRSKLDRLIQEYRNIEPVSDAMLCTAQQQFSVLQSKILDLKQHIVAHDSAHQIVQQQTNLATTIYQADLQQHQQVQAKLNALLEIEESFQYSQEHHRWLTQHQLHQLDPLVKRIRVSPGWEKAIESALRENLDALLIDDLTATVAWADTQLPKRQTFLTWAVECSHSTARLSTHLTPLTQKVECINSEIAALLDSLLAGYYCASSLESALQYKTQLMPHETIIVSQGHWVTAWGVTLYASDQDQAGRLQRLQHIEMLQTQLRALDVMTQKSLSDQRIAEAALVDSSTQGKKLRHALEELTQQSHQAQLKVVQLNELFERLKHRARQFESDKSHLEFELEAQQALIQDIQEQLEVTQQHCIDHEHKVVQLQQQLSDCERQWADKQIAMNDALQRVNQQQLSLKLTQSVLNQAQRDYQFAYSQVEKIKLKREQIQADFDTATSFNIESQLQLALAQQDSFEKITNQSKQTLDDAVFQISELEQQIKLITERSEPLRHQIQEFALAMQSVGITIEHNQTQLEECGANPVALMRLLEIQQPPPKASQLQSEISHCTQAMQALGLVNLAALDELNAAQERKAFLDQQIQDLETAIQTLEQAIAKIDRETRDLLKDTFNAVNIQFAQLFPKLFGGGQAKLIMMGDEILDAGVQVVAQPPGKKNGTIHLLSGGEKALTATALVFAIFQLNPAPFCLLDEVDAPLDDANTHRFACLVKQMSERTQFLFISHNKITMEIANQLIGVTMQEEGVSRIVAVDMATTRQLATERL